MDLYSIGDRIEGERCELYSRKAVKPACFQTHPVTGEKCMRVELSRNATAEISKEMELSEEEWEKRSNPHHLLGDKLIGDSISVFAVQRRPVRFSVTEGLTHTHGGHLASTQGPTLCELKYPHDHIRNAVEKRQLQSKKLLED